MNHVTTQTEWKVMLVVTILSLCKPLKSKQRSSPSSNRLFSVGERPRYDTIAILKSKPMSKQVSDGREQRVPLPYKTQEVTMCFENGRQTRTTRQERSKRPTLHTQHWDPQACSGGTLSPANASF